MPSRKEILETGKLLYDKGMVNAYEGNISAYDGDRITITPASVCKAFLTEEMLIDTDREGTVLDPGSGGKPSSEIRLHLAVYRHRPDVRAVVHAHPPFATAYAIANRPVETRAYPEMIVLFEKIPIAPYGTPSTDGIFQGAVPLMKNHDIILLANHGVVAFGKSVHEAFFKLESAESIAKTLLLTQLLGGEKELPPEELKILAAMREARNAAHDDA